MKLHQLVLFIVLWVPVVTSSIHALGADELPNIILCMGDDHGWEEVGYNGHPVLKTPTLDEMAASGLRLDNFYAAHPSCSPTRGSVLTGRHPNRYGTFTPNYSMRPEERTIAHYLKQAGYLCGHFGKWHVGPVKRESPTSPGAMGFDTWLSHDNFFELNPVLSRDGGPPQEFAGESSEVIVDATIRFLDQSLDARKPFLAVVWFGSPHEPYSGLEQDLALYDDLPQRFAAQQVRLTSNETGQSVRRPLREVLRERYAEITAMDRAMGKLRDALEERGVRDNTLLWYCGDNGTPSSGLAYSPLRGQKGGMYEGGIRVPGVIEWPAKIKQGRTSSVSAVTSDMLPTICAAVGLQPDPRRPLDGINLVALIEGKMTERPDPICFWSFDTTPTRKAEPKPYIDPELQKGTTPLVKLMAGIPTRNFRNYHHVPAGDADFRGERVILSGDHKLIVRTDSQGNTTQELYNLDKDRAETRNLVKKMQPRAQELADQLLLWQQSVVVSLQGADYNP